MGSTSIFFHSSSNCAIGIFENFPSDRSEVLKRWTRCLGSRECNGVSGTKVGTGCHWENPSVKLPICWCFTVIRSFLSTNSAFMEKVLHLKPDPHSMTSFCVTEQVFWVSVASSVKRGKSQFLPMESSHQMGDQNLDFGRQNSPSPKGSLSKRLLY